MFGLRALASLLLFLALPEIACLSWFGMAGLLGAQGGSGLWAQSGTSAQSDATGAETEARISEDAGTEEEALVEWRKVLLYGIDEEVLNVLDQIRGAGARSLDQELLQVLGESVNSAVRRRILSIFQANADRAAEGIALELLAGYEDQQRELTTALIGYLVTIESTDCLPLLKDLVDNEELPVATQAVKGLGELGSRAETTEEALDAFLLAKLEDEDTDGRLKPDIILALGELQSAAAVDRLVEIVEDREEDKGWRMYAAEALGRIGDERAIPALESLFAEQDALLKAYAASGLAHFPTEEVGRLLMQALKDSNWRVRITAAKALANPESEDALDILMYKARRDPVTAVRVEAVKALGEIGAAEGFDLLRELFADSGQSLEIRASCLDVLLGKDLQASMESLWTVVEEDIGKTIFKSKILEHTAKELAQVESMAVKGLLARLLEAQSPLVRISGVRGIALNRYDSLKRRLEILAEQDPHPGVRKEAAAALGKW